MIHFAHEYLINLTHEHFDFYKKRCSEDPNYLIDIYYLIFTEIKKILKDLSPAVYIIPSSYCPLVWNGLLTITNGIYQGFKCNFTVLISHEYPNQFSQPVRIFLSPPLYHPQVHIFNGELELSKVYQDISKEENTVFAAIQHLEQSFVNINCDTIDIKYPANTEAAILCCKNPKIYLEKILESNTLNIDSNNTKPTDEIIRNELYKDIHKISINEQDKSNMPNLDFDTIINKMKTFNQEFDIMMTEDIEEKELSYSWLKPSCDDNI